MNTDSGRKNKRKFPRMTTELPCAIHRLRTDGTEEPGLPVKARNIGLGGMMIETGIPLAAGDLLRIEFKLDNRRIEVLARVVFVQHDPGSLLQCGVEFTEILERDRDFILGSYLLKEYGVTP